MVTFLLVNNIYGRCSKISNALACPKGIPNRADPNQTASEEAV